MGVDRSSSVPWSDAEAITASLSRPELFADVFRRHFDAVHAYLARRTGAGRADDLAANVFVIAFERRGSFRADADSARPWLLGIATNALRNEWRSERRALELLTELRLAAGSSEAGGASDREAPLAAALTELSPDQRDVLLLHVWEDLSYDDIAQALEIPIGTVRSRLARARERLRSTLAEGAVSEQEVER